MILNGQRYSILRPLTERELHVFALSAFRFFSIVEHENIQKQMGWPKESDTMRPFSVGQFLNYLEKTGVFSQAHKYMHHVQFLTKKLAEQGVLTPAGTGAGSPGMNTCYYTMKELTKLEQQGVFWLATALGETYLRKLLEPYIVRIEGEHKEKGSGTGSGVLIAPDCILTCRHNIQDMTITSCWQGTQELKISAMQTHPKYDVGLIKLTSPVKYEVFPYFGPPYVLDKTLTLGYPPLRGMREPLLLAQSGEINAIGTEMISGCGCIAISSITRPGNSGGPVFSLRGYIVGIVIESATSAATTDTEKSGSRSEESPFYLAISSESLKTAISEIDSGFTVRFEDFQ